MQPEPLSFERQQHGGQGTWHCSHGVAAHSLIAAGSRASAATVRPHDCVCTIREACHGSCRVAVSRGARSWATERVSAFFRAACASHPFAAQAWQLCQLPLAIMEDARVRSGERPKGLPSPCFCVFLRGPEICSHALGSHHSQCGAQGGAPAGHSEALDSHALPLQPLKGSTDFKRDSSSGLIL